MTFRHLKTDQRIIRFSLSLILLTILLVAVFVNPENYRISNCFIHDATGYSCPSCGLTRSFHAAANFHPNDSFAFHVMGPILFGVTILLFFKLFFESISGWSIDFQFNAKFTKWTLLVVGTVWLIDWAVRLLAEIGS